MIVVSGVLVAVALVLLVVGLQVSLGYIYASIGVSVLAFLLLRVATMRRRRAAPAAAPAPRPAAEPASWSGSAVSTDEPVDEPAPAYVPAEPSPWRDVAEPELPGWRSGPEPEPPVEDDDDLLEDEDLLGGERYGGTVLVVPGRPRYHVAGCRYLLGKESAELDVVDAREEGFQPCGICRPDVVLAGELAEADLVAQLRDQRRDVVHLDADAPEPADLQLVDGPDDEPRARRAGGGSVPVATRPRPVAGREPRTPAEPVPPPVPDVVLVPERGRYHRPTCRYARGVTGAVTVAPDAARAAGAEPCGICKP